MVFLLTQEIIKMWNKLFLCKLCKTLKDSLERRKGGKKEHPFTNASVLGLLEGFTVWAAHGWQKADSSGSKQHSTNACAVFETSGLLLLLYLSRVSQQLAYHISDHTWSSLFLVFTTQDTLMPHITRVSHSQALADLEAAASGISATTPGQGQAPAILRQQPQTHLRVSAATRRSQVHHLKPSRMRGLCHGTRLQAGATEVALSTL